MSVDLSGFGHRESEAVTGNETITAADYGLVRNVTASATITLPATEAGAEVVVRVGAPGITVNVSPAATDLIKGNGEATGTDNKDLIFTTQPAGSFVRLVGNGTTGWIVAEISGTATFEA